ncbi:CHAT domain-containing protein [Streptomyces sp. NPDC127190]|uniref:CHAT domain-containing protein n=1 Tax=unclassified Streptomyces TaxID=2593676 RepID=UPI003639890C
MTHPGRPQPSAAALSEELDACLASPPDAEHLDGLLDSVRQTAEALIEQGAPQEALPIVRQGEALATLTGSTEHAVHLRVLLAEAEDEEEAALAWCRSAAELAARQESGWLCFWTLVQVSGVFARLNRWRPAAVLLAQATVMSEGAQRHEYTWPAAMQAARAYLTAGELHLAQEFLELAQAAYERADGVSASGVTGEELALAWAELANELLQDAPQAAAEAAGHALALAPGRFESLRVRAHALILLEDYPNAVTAYRAWLEVAPGSAFAWNNLAVCLSETGEPEGALEAWARAAAAAPEELRFRVHHARALVVNGHLDAAVAEFGEVIRIGEALEAGASGGSAEPAAEPVATPSGAGVVPSGPGVTPSGPAVATPSGPAVATPSGPAVATPSGPAVATPSGPDATPSGAGVVPFGPAVTPSGPAVATSSGPAAIPSDPVNAPRPLPDSVARQIDVALTERALINLERGRTEPTAADAERLLARPSVAARTAGHALRAELCERRGDLEGALAECERAPEPSTGVLELHARLLLRGGRDDEALDVLERLASREHAPETAVEILDEMVERLPGRARPLAVRGLAHFQAERPRRALADLRAAVAAGHTAWRTYLLLGLSCVRMDPGEGDSQSIDLMSGLKALGRAVLCAAEQGGDPEGEATGALVWLLDRMFGASRFLDAAAVTALLDLEPPWLSAVPQLRPALVGHYEAGMLVGEGKWREAADIWESVQLAFEAAGFPVSAARTSLAIADALLRVQDLDAVAAHLDRADGMTLLLAKPMTANLRTLDHPQDQVAWMELEYLDVYGIGAKEYINVLRGLRIIFTARSGDVRAAAEEIGDGSWVFVEEDGRTVVAPGLSVTGVTSLAQILRDAGQWERAAELLTTALTTEQGARHAGAHATFSTLVVDDFAESTRYLDLATEYAADWQRPALLTMRAQLCLLHERWDEALELLDAAASAATEYGLAFELLRSRVELGRGNAAEAADLVVRLVARAEESRLNLSRWELRMAWSGTAVPLYRTAIEACLAAGRTLAAFDFAERARARAFLDEDALADPEVDALVTAQRERQEELDWLDALTTPYTAADVARLLLLEGRYGGSRELPEGFRVHTPTTRIDTSDIRHRLRNDHEALTRDLDRAQVEAMRRQGVEPVGWQRLHEAVGGAAHIALYHVLDSGRVLLFTSGAGAEPRAVTIEVDLYEIGDVLDAAVRGTRFDFRTVDLERLQRAAAPLVAPLAAVPADELIALVPHGALHDVPLHVLEVAGVPLGLRNPVCYAPSASLLVRRLSSSAPQASGEPLVVGDPGGDLAHARIEAVTVARQLGIPPVLGEDVSKRLVTDALLRTQSPPGLVHLAAHGILDTADGAVGIVLGGARAADGRERQILGAADLRGARLSAALVVLSCCTSGVNGMRPGDELTGLVRSFLTAGAASVIVSQWSVDDLSTSLLMRAFYERLGAAASDGAPASLAHALRDAVLRVRSLTRQQVADLTAPDTAGGLTGAEPATRRALRIGSAALSTDFATARAALAVSSDPALRDAALEAEERREALAAAGLSEEDRAFPFRHPHYWAPFVLVGDWRLPRPGDGRAREAAGGSSAGPSGSG